MIVQLIVGMILARLLTPSEFGVFAILMVFTAFFNLMSDIGIAPAVIQSKTVNTNDFLNYFYLSIALGIILTSLFIVLTYFLVRFYSNEVYLKLGLFSTFTIFFTSISILPSAVLSKHKKFKELGILKLTAALISGIIAIFLAYRNFSYYSLVVQSIIYAVVIFLGSFFLSKFYTYFKKDKISISEIKISLRKIARYSSYNFAYNFINYFSRNLDNILIGKFLGPASLGFYDKAYRLILFPVSSLNQVFSPIMHPLLADYQENKEFIYQVFSKMIRLLSLIGISTTVFLYINAGDIILIMYGNQWENSIPIFKILGLTVWIQILVSTTGAVFLASNKANLYFYDGVFNALIIVTAIVLGVIQGDLIKLSYFLLTGYYLASIVTFYFVMIRIFNKKSIHLFKILMKPAIVGLFVLISSQLNSLIVFDNMILRLFVSFAFAIVGFSAGLFLTKEHRFLLQVINKK